MNAACSRQLLSCLACISLQNVLSVTVCVASRVRAAGSEGQNAARDWDAARWSAGGGGAKVECREQCAATPAHVNGSGVPMKGGRRRGMVWRRGPRGHTARRRDGQVDETTEGPQLRPPTAGQTSAQQWCSVSPGWLTASSTAGAARSAMGCRSDCLAYTRDSSSVLARAPLRRRL